MNFLGWTAVVLVSLAQDRSFYRGPGGDLTAEYEQGVLTRTSAKTTRLTVSGRVTATSEQKGLKMSATRATLDIESVNRKSTLQRMQAKGNVVLTKIGVGAAASNQITVNALFADLRSTSQSDQVQLTGPVVITQLDAKKNQSVVARGANGSAALDRASNPLKAASLVGSVSVDFRDAPVQGSRGAMVHATGQRLDMTRVPTGSKLVLNGKVKVKFDAESGVGDYDGEVVTLFLNEKGELVKLQNGGGA